MEMAELLPLRVYPIKAILMYRIITMVTALLHIEMNHMASLVASIDKTNMICRAYFRKLHDRIDAIVQLHKT